MTRTSKMIAYGGCRLGGGFPESRLDHGYSLTLLATGRRSCRAVAIARLADRHLQRAVLSAVLR